MQPSRRLSRRAKRFRHRWLPGPLHSLGALHLPFTRPRTTQASGEVVVVNVGALGSKGQSIKDALAATKANLGDPRLLQGAHHRLVAAINAEA